MTLQERSCIPKSEAHFPAATFRMDHDHVPSSPIHRAHDQSTQDRPSTSDSQRIMIAGPSDTTHVQSVTATHGWNSQPESSAEYGSWNGSSPPALDTFPPSGAEGWAQARAENPSQPNRPSHAQPSVLNPCAPESSDFGSWAARTSDSWTSGPAVSKHCGWQQAEHVQSYGSVSASQFGTTSSATFYNAPSAWPSHPSSESSRLPPSQPSVTPSSTLLTSEPLFRAASDSASPPARLGKRRRAASLPLIVPAMKRSRRHNGPLRPSEPWQWRLLPAAPAAKPSSGSAQRPAAPSSVTRPKKPTPSILKIPSHFRRSPIVASRRPPVNLASLRTLDAGELLRNHQLRHDLVLEPLVFRPVNVSQPVENPTVEMYWKSIARELAYGCRCTRWYVPESDDPFKPEVLAEKKLDNRCMCGGWMLSSSEDKWWKAQESQWTSRIPPMVESEWCQ